MSGKKTFDTIDHAVNMSDLVTMCSSFFDDAVKTGVDHCGRSAGLTYKNIFTQRKILLSFVKRL